MNPKTKLQKRVAELRSKLPSLDLKQKNWAKRIIVIHEGYATKDRVLCTECGCRFKNTGFKNGVLHTCPSCLSKIKIVNSKKTTSRQDAYFCIVDKLDDFQVFRYVFIRRTSKSFAPAEYLIDEVMQKWMNEDGTTIIAKSRLMGSSYMFDGWAHSSNLEIRQGGVYYYSFDYCVPVDNTYPIQKWKTQYLKYGVNKQIKMADPYALLNSVTRTPSSETLLKAKQYSLLAYKINGRSYEVEKNWPSIKICMRKKYIVKDASMYIDYLNLLSKYEKDIRNAHYVCPIDLKKEHDYYVEKRKKDIEKEAKERKIKQMLKQKEEEKAFLERIAKFENLTISDSRLSIAPLKTLEEFMQEGKEMHHCVFSSGYWKKSDCLILSARIENQRIETIEVNLKTFSIIQSRAVFNGSSEHHDKIVNLVKKNINKIRKLATA